MISSYFDIWKNVNKMDEFQLWSQSYFLSYSFLYQHMYVFSLYGQS